MNFDPCELTVVHAAQKAPKTYQKHGSAIRVGYLLCEAPRGPFRQKVPDTYFPTIAYLDDNTFQRLAGDSANIVNPGNLGHTPLMVAAINGHVRHFERLINLGSHTDLTDEDGKDLEALITESYAEGKKRQKLLAILKLAT